MQSRLNDILPANCDLADLAGRNRIAVLVQDRSLAAGCETYRPRFSVSLRQGVTGYLVRRLCHAIGLDYGHVEYRFQFHHSTRRQA